MDFELSRACLDTGFLEGGPKVGYQLGVWRTARSLRSKLLG